MAAPHLFREGMLSSMTADGPLLDRTMYILQRGVSEMEESFQNVEEGAT